MPGRLSSCSADDLKKAPTVLVPIVAREFGMALGGGSADSRLRKRCSATERCERIAGIRRNSAAAHN